MREHLHLLGWRHDIAELLQVTDVLALTSRWEGLPRVFPQAMAAGVPIVATRVDGAPEAVIDGVNGFLLAPGRSGGNGPENYLSVKKSACGAQHGEKGPRW